MQQYRVLVVDDCHDEALTLCEGLKLNNYDAEAVHTAKDALSRCHMESIDLVLLDVNLPDDNGFAVCEALKSDPKTADIPVVFVSGHDSSDDIAEGYKIGAADYITKPYNLPMVMVRVDSVIRSRRVAEFSQDSHEQLLDTAYTDQLTGLRNQRFLMERLQEEVEKAHRYDYPVSCLVVDLDEVRALDDELGAASLDDVLVEVAMAMRNNSRTYDVLARYDAGLFAAVLPHARLQDAVSYATKIESEIGSTTFSEPSFPTEAKLSFGIVSCRNGSSRGAEHLLGEAMRRLLYAKSNPSQGISGRDLNEG